MSGIYISGVKMPEKDQLVIFRIWGNGQVERLEGYRPFLLYGVKATDIPNHGRLIDADALKARVQKLQEWLWDKLTDADVGIVTADDVKYRIAEEFEEFIDDAPTIIPADKEDA